MRNLRLGFLGSGASTSKNNRSRTKKRTRKKASNAVTTFMSVLGLSLAKKNLTVCVD